MEAKEEPIKGKKVSKAKTLVLFVVTIILGYECFIAPDLFIGVTKINEGEIGVNLVFITLFQLVTVSGLIYVSLKTLNKNFGDIGLRSEHLGRDIVVGLVFGALCTVLQFVWIIPNTGAIDRPDIAGMLDVFDGIIIGTLSFIGLGVISGGTTEALFNGRFFINILKDVFKNPKAGPWFSAILSIGIFALGHMPSTALDWLDILVPTIIYTLLFLFYQKTDRFQGGLWSI